MKVMGRNKLKARKDKLDTVGPLAAFLIAAIGGIWVVSCAPKRPASLPVTGIYSRGTSRLEVSRVVVNDPKRREQVHATYERIVIKTEAFAESRNQMVTELVRLSQADELDESSISNQVDALKKKQTQEFEDYIDLQMKLRKLTSEDEFNKLGKFD